MAFVEVEVAFWEIVTNNSDQFDRTKKTRSNSRVAWVIN